jgi:small subunit ribosomal protein S6
MRHYEIVFLVHPDQSDQTQSVLNKFSSIVTESGGKVHRLENIGSRKLAYPIHDQYKATYALLNIECKEEAISEIQSSFKFNDSIIRSLVLSRNKAEADVSALSKQTEEDESEYLKENDKTRESQSKSLDTEIKEEETPVKESSEESMKTEIESSQE